MRPPNRLRAAAVTVVGIALAAALLATPPAQADTAPGGAGDPAADATSPPAPAETADPGAPPATVPVASRLDRLIHRRLKDPRLGRTVSVLVTDAATGQVLAAEQPDRPMQAASNMKILTAMTALATMGPDRRFPTRVALDGDHVIVQGGGDPMLTRADVRAIARATAAALPAGLPVVVDVDTSLFADATYAPGWVDAYIGSSVGLVQSLGLLGDRSRRPAYTVADAMVADLRDAGVAASRGGFRAVPPGAPVLLEFAGHTVQEAVARMLNASDSAVAEVLFQQVALATGRPATWAGAQEAAVATLTSLGLDLTGIQLVDGSGLSRDDRLTPRLIESALRLAAVTDPGRFAAMFPPSALPIAGRTGTLTPAYGRYSTRPSRCARGLVQAKTGTILATIALSGVARTVDGQRRLFSIIVNDRPTRVDVLDTRRAVDGLAATITGCWD